MSKKIFLSAMVSLVVLTGFSGSALAHSSALMVHTHQNVISAAGVSVVMPSQVMSRLKVAIPPRPMAPPLVVMPAQEAEDEDASSAVPLTGIPLFWNIMERSGLDRMLFMFGFAR